MPLVLAEDDHAVLSALLASNAPLGVDQIVSTTGRNQSIVVAVASQAEKKGWVAIETGERIEIVPGPKAALAVEGRLPERLFLERIAAGGRLPMSEVVAFAKEKGVVVSEIVKWGTARGWLSRVKDELVLSETGRRAVGLKDDDERTLTLAVGKESLFLDDVASRGIDPARVQTLLRNRAEVAKLKTRNLRSLRLTDVGRRALSGPLEVARQINQLTSDEITSGSWRTTVLRPYDVTLAAQELLPAKTHPLGRIIEQTRRAFLAMGFTEVASPLVESAFWNFDALFQPQDHPARDMQDTFYLDRPARARLPAPDLVERIRMTHEDGGGTGSAGWGYRWSPEEAARTVLRTHTTAATIRAVAENPAGPRKVFCVGRVFRNETVSYKHLPEFTQVDGVIIDEAASLSTLLGTLAEFYRQMGFEKMKFKPSFFPYTEPSAEVFVWFDRKKTWIELGGCGVFRPEVTIPLGCKVPVIAWGLGLERLAMLRYDLADIRELYLSDLDLIRNVRLCQ